MGKKRCCWFTYMRKLLSITKTKPKSKESTNKDLKKNWRWFSEVMFKFKHDSPALEAPQHPWKTLNEATEEQRKHALAVAKATAAAAEAAVAAANAATEVVRLTNRPFELEKKIKYLAAVRIQCAYRGHLARKALSALKGLVKLQAVIRGELMRRKVVKTLASMMFSDSKLQPLVREKRALSDFLYHGEARRSISQREGQKSGELKLQRSWDLSLVSKDEIEARYLQKQEAIAKRERMKQYSYSHRELRNDQIIQESVSDTENRRSRRSHRYEEADNLKPLYCSNTIFGTSRLKLKDSEASEASDSPFSQPRRSFCYVKQKSIGDDGSLTSSPVFPAYMSATKSASAKSRSLSTPRQRLRFHESYSSEYSPREFRLSSLSSIDGEATKRCKTKSITQHICSTLGTLNC